MAVLRTFVCLAAIAMLMELAMAANYTVGGANGGWDTSTDLQSWVAAQTFAVGDNLIFQYTPNHDVLEVTKADHDSCQTGNPLQTYNDGNTVVPLTTPGKRYFICGTLGHCSQGMQIEIDTLATSMPPATSPSSPPPSSPSPETSPSPANTPESVPGSPLSPDVPSDGAPSGVSPSSPPPPSSAIKNSFGTLGFGLVLMVFLAF
ncbi:transcription factor ILR3-like [Hibiscus syriacus]|uniref:Transcription factor ILR3-like n=1 Tax=Hibiscus syriacus TaxID=106335 RepID=A0A6A3BA06_HIBSY|nr:uclacyanin 1-like [Hibiscus syriacus]KAE8712827.1 transcription factor ILR3-like [Hibiscus syriacus]